MVIQDTITPKIKGLMESIEQLSGHGIIYQGLHDQQTHLTSKVCRFCKQALNHPSSASLCRLACRNATLHAMDCGEPYFQRCWANILFAVIPIAPHNKCCGALTISGFCAAGEQDEIRDSVSPLIRSWPHTNPATFLDPIASITAISPRALRGLADLAMESSFSAGLNSSDFFRRQNEKYLQQRRIAEALAEIRKQDVTPADSLGDTFHLLEFLNHNDKAGALGYISQYLAKQLMASNWDDTRFKARIRLLLAALTSQSILTGTPWAAACAREMRQMLRLENSHSIEESCYAVAEWVQNYFEGQQNIALTDSRPLGDRLANWLQTHYQDSVTIADAARAIGTSSSTLVHRLRRETGKTFKLILTEIRLAEAKKLLATTSLELSGIGDLCGFFDQSHFTREFKRAINLTPGQFKKLLTVPAEALKQTGMKNLDDTAPLRKVSSSRGTVRSGRSGRGVSRRPRNAPR